ncbi:MAG TPA: sugar transferase [Candidatus Sumerlaeota bacterium]|nr:sugar transferase [Candidatus Sumerlaeota bacterium]
MRSFWRGSLLTFLLLLADSVALALLWFGVYGGRAVFNASQVLGQTLPVLNPWRTYADALPFLLPAFLCVLIYFRFYSHHERIESLNDLRPILWALFWIAALAALYNTTHKSDFGRTIVLGYALATGLYLFASRTLLRVLKRRAVSRGHGLVRVLVAGSGELARETLMRLHEHPDIGFRVVGVVAAGDSHPSADLGGYPVLGRLEDLIAILERTPVEEVFLAVPEMREDAIFGLVREVLDRTDATCKVVANLLYVIANRAKVDEIIGLPVIAFPGGRLNAFQLAIKRGVDLILAGLGLLFLGPLAVLFALLVRLDSPGPALFRHERVGLDGRPFSLLKFRTMFLDSDPYAEAPADQNDSRITRFGRFLRRTSLDELPQLLNILKGEMSLVGPRPEMPFIVATYKPWQAGRLRVKPGLTGLWQVAGRKTLPLHDNLEYDFFYVCNPSLALDLEILLRTLPAVLRGKGAF